MIYARDLSITWGNDKRYWRWDRVKEIGWENLFFFGRGSSYSLYANWWLFLVWELVLCLVWILFICRDIEIEVAVLLRVCWLEVRGKLEASFLSPGVIYEVVFVVMIEEASYGLEDPVKLKLVSPVEEVHERREKLQDKPKNQWLELRVGDFENPRDGSGEIQFSLSEYKDARWMNGLIIKGVIFRPMKANCKASLKITGRNFTLTTE